MTEVCPEQKKEAIHPHNSSPDFRQCAFSLAHPHKVSFPPRSVTVDASSYFPPSLPTTMNPQHSTRNPVHPLSANPPETFPPPAPLLNFEAFPFYLSFFFLSFFTLPKCTFLSAFILLRFLSPLLRIGPARLPLVFRNLSPESRRLRIWRQVRARTISPLFSLLPLFALPWLELCLGGFQSPPILSPFLKPLCIFNP